MPRAVSAPLNVALLAWLIPMAASPVGAQDRVTALDSRQREVVRTGKILRYDGRELRIRLASGNETRIPSRLVKDVQTTLLPAHTEADLHFDKGDTKSMPSRNRDSTT